MTIQNAVDLQCKHIETPYQPQLSSFIKRYSTFLSQWNDQRLQEFTCGFSGIRAGLRSIGNICSEHDRCVAPDFNFFRVMRIHSRENRTHSALLANLLDPNGSHGQGPLFLSVVRLGSCTVL